VTAQGLTIEAIIITHHHRDHTGGVEALLASDANIQVYGKTALFSDINLVDEGQQLTFFNGQLTLNVWQVAGHTLDHIVYFNDEMLFCGDTLFSGGCGRVFEGTHQQMFDALSRLSGLNAKTKVYCAHEYTQNNLIFAVHVDPHNRELIDYVKSVSKSRQQGIATIPTTIEREKLINPFLRCDEPALLHHLQSILAKSISPGLQCFQELRAYKDQF
jgi:hydroxyacylglutathione hydrolase